MLSLQSKWEQHHTLYQSSGALTSQGLLAPQETCPEKKENYNKEAIRAIKIAFYCKWRRVNASLKYCCTWNSLLVAYPHFIWNLSMFPFLFLSSVFFGLTGPEKPTFWPVSTQMAANFARFILNLKIQLDLLSYFCLFD